MGTEMIKNNILFLTSKKIKN